MAYQLWAWVTLLWSPCWKNKGTRSLWQSFAGPAASYRVLTLVSSLASSAVCWRKSLWCGASTITPRFLSAQRSAPDSPWSLHFERTQWPPSGAVLGSSQDCHQLSPAGWKQLPNLQTLGHEMIYICNSCISSNLLQHLQQPSCPVNSPTSGCILGFAHFPLVPTFQNFYIIYKATFGLFLP